MNHISKTLTSYAPFLRRIAPPLTEMEGYYMQWSHGIRVKVLNGNLEHALTIMERKMKSSGMEQLIKRHIDHHIKNSEKRVLARKNLELQIRSKELARKLRTILIKKISCP